jgi:hypothetical protein
MKTSLDTKIQQIEITADIVRVCVDASDHKHAEYANAVKALLVVRINLIKILADVVKAEEEDDRLKTEKSLMSIHFAILFMSISFCALISINRTLQQ